jgi:hypothetical protein
VAIDAIEFLSISELKLALAKNKSNNLFLSISPGRGISIFSESLPPRSNAGSKISILFVAPITNTPLLSFIPSISCKI